ncbi:hypothetical protein Tco_1087650 [Tanacetum coccineum]
MEMVEKEVHNQPDEITPKRNEIDDEEEDQTSPMLNYLILSLIYPQQKKPLGLNKREEESYEKKKNDFSEFLITQNPAAVVFVDPRPEGQEVLFLTRADCKLFGDILHFLFFVCCPLYLVLFQGFIDDSFYASSVISEEDSLCTLLLAWSDLSWQLGGSPWFTHFGVLHAKGLGVLGVVFVLSLITPTNPHADLVDLILFGGMVRVAFCLPYLFIPHSLRRLGLGIKFDVEIQGLWLLGTLPDTWETFRTSLDEKKVTKVPFTLRCRWSRKAGEEVKSKGTSKQKFLALVERLTGRNLNVFEVIQLEVNTWPLRQCIVESHRIQHQNAPPKTPAIEMVWQNGLNRTLVHVINLTPCVLFGGFDVPDRVWCGNQKMFLTIILRSLDVRQSVHFPKDERTKLVVKIKHVCSTSGSFNGQDELGSGYDEETNDEEHGDDDMRGSTRGSSSFHTLSCNNGVIVLLTDGGEPECYAECREVGNLFKKKSILDTPEGFQVKGKEDYVCRDFRRVCWVEESTETVWYKKFESVIGKQGFRKTFSDHCVFFQSKKMEELPIDARFEENSFAMKDWGLANNPWHLVGRDKRVPRSLHYITRGNNTVRRCCAYGILKRWIEFHIALSGGCLMLYAMVCTRPDLAHAVGVVSRFLSNPGKKHWEVLNGYFVYLRLGITFGNGDPMLVGYTDLRFGMDNKEQHEVDLWILMTLSGGSCFMRSRDCKVVWPCLLQRICMWQQRTSVAKKLLWLKWFLQELGFQQLTFYAVSLCDIQS